MRDKFAREALSNMTDVVRIGLNPQDARARRQGSSKMNVRKALAVGATLFLAACGGGGGGEGGGSIDKSEYKVFAWNDLGMHCANPDYASAVILPPYNVVWAQVVRRGNPPEIITDGITVSYRIIGNTTSQKTSATPWPSDWRTFWDNSEVLFGVTLADDTGLNLKDPTTHNGLSGDMALFDGDHFEAVGIPVTPLKDDLTWEPYQVAEITVKDGSNVTIAQTRATVPVSDEISCSGCHGDNGFLADHDEDQGTNLVGKGPFLCAECHASPALGIVGRIDGKPYLSEAIHKFHGNLAVDERPACYDCHPGAVTKCNRSKRHTDATYPVGEGKCTECHGTLAEVGQSITDGRTPWADEPKCADCHSAAIYDVDTGSTLYRNARGHGGMSCAACHGSPHAMVPSFEASDNYQALQYMGKAVTIGSCAACHDSSRGEGASEFIEQHGSGTSACSVCHTTINTTSNWPHKFQWQAR